jgi:hypothetical protein
MQRAPFIVGSFLLCLLPGAASACSQADLDGPFGLLLHGESTISGKSAPAIVLTRLVFDGDGRVSGYSSVNFNGLLPANPVTGTYNLQTDCLVTVSLQGESGARQHFTGKVTPRGADLQQTNTGAAIHGVMLSTPDECSLADFRPRYALTLSETSALSPAGNGPSAGSAKGTISTTGSDRFDFNLETLSGDGTLDVQPDCTVNLKLHLSDTDIESMSLRGILVNGGRTILAVGTDPAVSVEARLQAR